MSIPILFKRQIDHANNKIIDGMNINRKKLESIDLLMKTITIKDVETNWISIKSYIEWSSKEIQKLYDNNEKLLNKTTEQINKM